MCKYNRKGGTDKMRTYKSIDLFAGIGGIRLGFEKAFGKQIETVFVSECDEHAQKTYRANFKDNFDIAGDITKIDESDVPSFDICLAGFPCQAFSMAGKRQGFNDDYKGLCRGTLFLDVARICEEHKPDVIFCENVKGLVIHDRGRTLEIIKKTFEDLGYKVFTNDDKTLNSKDFGVPQNRERIYIVAFRNDIAPEKFDFPQKTDDTKRISDIIEEKPVSPKYYLSDVYLETLRQHKARHEAKGNGFGYEIRAWDDVAPVDGIVSATCLCNSADVADLDIVGIRLLFNSFYNIFCCFNICFECAVGFIVSSGRNHTADVKYIITTFNTFLY